jgi:hypothetical protein
MDAIIQPADGRKRIGPSTIYTWFGQHPFKVNEQNYFAGPLNLLFWAVIAWFIWRRLR